MVHGKNSVSERTVIVYAAQMLVLPTSMPLDTENQLGDMDMFGV